MNMDIGSTGFWLGLLEIIWVNILLSGDNAVVIALAARSLPDKQQMPAIAIGSAAAIALRIILTLVAAELLLLPWLKVIGAILLVYIGVNLLLPEGENEGPVKRNGSMLVAIRTILVADLIMSLDNVVAVAAAAHDSIVLLSLGLLISIPIVIFGSTLLLKVIDRLPILVWMGAALLGFIAGEMLVGDPALVDSFNQVSNVAQVSQHQFALAAGAVGALMVIFLAKIFLAKAKSD